MLANLLPGLRDLRAPLAAGYLWLLVGWIQFAPKIPANPKEATGVAHDLYILFQAAGRPAIAVASASAAYLIGILFIGLLSKFMLTLGTAAAIVAEIAQRTRRNQDPATAIRDQLWSRIEELVLTVMRDRYENNEIYREAVIIHVPPTTWEEVYRIAANFYSPLGPSWKFYSTEPREAVLTMVESNEDILNALLRRVIDIFHHVSDVRRSLPLVPEKLVEKRPKTYERWDRLDSEGDFRQAVAVPLFVLPFTLCLRGAVPWPFLPLLVLPSLVILYQGYKKHIDATTQLVQAIEAGIATLPAVDRLKSTNLYWDDISDSRS